MRIISQFKDYYDYGIAFGVDPNIVYHRIYSDNGYYKTNNEIVRKLLDKKFIPVGEIWNKNKIRRTFGAEYLVICDKIFPCFIENNVFNVKNERHYNIKEFADNTLLSNQYVSDIDEVCRDIINSKVTNEKSPIVLIRSKYLIRNPKLLDLDFNKIQDANTVFQNISMFIGQQMNEKELVSIDDEYKIVEHGFDDKSFKNTGKRMK